MNCDNEHLLTQKVRKLHAMNYSAMHSFIFNRNNSNKKLRWRALKVAFVPRWKDCSVYVHKHNKNNIMRGWRKWFSVRNWLHAALVFLCCDFCMHALRMTYWSGLLDCKNQLRDCVNLERNKCDSWPREMHHTFRDHTHSVCFRL